ncbi:hypothetical protein [Pasteuria penetrans]|uniref:hypothetical protein n=1 Tax=Pasteuria penetrans TaxID=86005 RepID=UPI000FBC1998|nr:hypothetical protein [Pasteuria penetrans]
MALEVGLSYAKSSNKPTRAIEEIDTMLMFVKPDRKLNLYDYVSFIRPAGLSWFHNTDTFFLCIQDCEALSVVPDRELVREYAYGLAGVYLALGVNREENFFMFLESDVPEAMEIAGVLECLIQKGDWKSLRTLGRGSGSPGSVSSSVIPFPRYPVLQAAQCLAYPMDAMILPRSEVALSEWTSALGERFHGLHTGESVFRIPEILHPVELEPLRALDDPHRAMGDTGPGGCIYLLDPLASTARKFRKLALESGGIVYDPREKPVISNLLTLCRWATGFSYPYMTGRLFSGMDHDDFKKAAKEMAYILLRPVQRNYKEAVTKGAIAAELRKGAQKARSFAGLTCQKMREVLGRG